MAWKLAQTGKRILLLERGDYLRREKENWESQAVFIDARYQAPETWHNSKGDSFHPGLHYFVGGQQQGVWVDPVPAARGGFFWMFGIRTGSRRPWPVGYAEFEPYYQAAEELLPCAWVCAVRTPTEPPAAKPYAYPPVSHEPRIQELFRRAEGRGAASVPSAGRGVARREGRASRCRIRRASGVRRSMDFPCLVNGKSDAQVICVDPAVAGRIRI